MSTDILAAIDGAIEGWEVGPDAMRWTTEPPAHDVTLEVSRFRDGFATYGLANMSAPTEH